MCMHLLHQNANKLEVKIQFITSQIRIFGMNIEKKRGMKFIKRILIHARRTKVQQASSFR